MKATIINIGDELLIGQIVNTNATWMARQLNKLGIKVAETLVIADNKEAIKSALDRALEQGTFVFFTGGLGPTKDDITKNTLAEYFDMSLEFHQPTFDNIKQLFAQYDKVADERYKLQSHMPKGARVLINKVGTASGIWIQTKENKLIISLPGVPREMKYLIKYEALPLIRQQYKTPEILHKTILTTGIGETDLSEVLEDFENNLPHNISLAYLPNTMEGAVRLRLSASGSDAILLETQLDQKVSELPDLIGQYIFGEDNETLAYVLGRILRQRGLTLGTAESCTGGNIAHKITSVSGCSAYFEGSIVAYSNKMKENILGVSPKDLEEFGAVSEPVAIQMAKGVQKQLGVDCGIAVTGIAGPVGGSPEKPVGTIWVAVAYKDQVVSKKLSLGKDRLQNIERTTTIAMNILRQELLQIVTI